MTGVADALATARKAKGLSQAQLAELAGVRQATISRYEGERRDPPADVVDRLAEALGVTPAFLGSVDKVRGAWAIDSHMRRRATAKARVWRQLEAQLNMLRHHARYVYEEVDILAETSVPLFDPLYTEPEDAARLTRMQWRLPIGAVRSLTQWLESAGCLVVEEDFGTDRVDGLSQWIDDHPVLLLNSTAPTDRKRLTMAHELGHLVLHTSEVSDDMEREANRFAAEFLMPAEVIRPQLRNLTLGRLTDLKRVWGVSMQALIERAASLRLITPDRRTAFYKQLSARGWRMSEPVSAELPTEQPQLARRIGQKLVDAGLTPDEIARFAGYSRASSEVPFLPDAPRLRAV